MSWLENSYAPAMPSAQATHTPVLAKQWPLYLVLALSLGGVIAAVFRSPMLSTIAYLTILILGCGLLFYRRYDAIAATRSAGGSGAISIQPIEKGTVGALALACLINGVVIAFEVARWPIWVQIREQIL